MTDAYPSPTTFDPTADGLPDALSPERLPLGGAGRIVAFITTGSPDVDHWGPNSVVGVAREWASQGMRVFLADLDFADPQLHRVLELPNEEGVTDAFSFGASVQRVARRVGELPFFLAPAGTAVYDQEAILASDRWDLLAEGFGEAGAALLLYVPEDAPGRDHVLRRATDVVIVGERAPEALPDDGRSASRMLAWIAPNAEEVDALPATVNGLAQADEAKLEQGEGPDSGEGPQAAQVLEVSTEGEDASAGSTDIDVGVGEGVDLVGELAEGGLAGDRLAEDRLGEDKLADDALTEDLVPDVDVGADASITDDFDRFAEAAQEGTPFDGLALDIHEEFQGGDATEVVGEAAGLTGELESPTSGLDLADSRDADSQDADSRDADSQDADSQDADSQDADSQDLATGEDLQVDEAAPVTAGGPPEESHSEYESILGDDVPEPTGVTPPAPLNRERRPPAKPKSRRWLVWGGMAAALVLGGYQIFGGGNGAGGAGGQPTPEGAAGPAEATAGVPDAPTAGDEVAETPAAPVDPGEPTSPLQEYSVVLRSNSNSVEAQDLADRLSEEVGELLFNVVPAAVNGRTWYRTMAGPARDLEETPGIKERIELAGVLAGADDWFERRTRYAFLLGESSTIEEADALALTLRDDSVPAYVLAIDYERGPRRFRVYAGGYVSDREAEPLGQILSQGGHAAELVDRLGSMPR